MEDLSNNYWGTSDLELIRGTIYDFYWNASLKEVVVEPISEASVVTVGGAEYPCLPSVSKEEFFYNGEGALCWVLMGSANVRQ